MKTGVRALIIALTFLAATHITQEAQAQNMSEFIDRANSRQTIASFSLAMYQYHSRNCNDSAQYRMLEGEALMLDTRLRSFSTPGSRYIGLLQRIADERTMCCEIGGRHMAIPCDRAALAEWRTNAAADVERFRAAIEAYRAAAGLN